MKVKKLLLLLIAVPLVLITRVNLYAATVTTIAAGNYPDAVGVNPVTNKIYAMNYSSGTVTVIDGTVTKTLMASGWGSMGITVNGGPSYSPSAIAVNPVTNRIYIAHYSTNNVTVINGATDTVIGSGIYVGTSPMAIAVNADTNKIYVANNVSNSVSVIDGASNSVIATVAVGSNPRGLAVNPVTNLVYVANYGSNTISVIDASNNNSVTTVPGIYSNPERIAVNPVTNKIYVGVHNPSNITIINGVDNTTATTTGAPISGFSYAPAIAVNPVTNTIYVADGVNSGKVAAIHGADNSQSTALAVGATPGALAVNPVTNTLYVGNQNSSYISSIDCAAWSTATTISGLFGAGWALGINPTTNTIYVPGYFGYAYVNAVQESAVPAVPLATAITPFAGDSTASTMPAFTFVTTTGANWPAVRNVYYQMDSTSGAWQKAALASVNKYSTTSATLTTGPHTIYAFATDGQDSTSVNTGPGASPLVGAMASYAFTVATAPINTTTGPGITSTSPVSGASAVVVTSPIKVTFSEDIDPSTLTLPNFSVNNGDVAGTVSYDVPTKTAVFTPTAVLANGTTYAVTIKSGASGLKSLTGSPLTADFIFSFSTETACASLPSKPVSWWNGEGNTNDLIGPNTGTLNNGATYTVGKVGQAFSFDGVDDSFSSTDTGMPSGNSPRSVVFWMQWLGGSGNNAPFIYGYPSASSAFYTIVIGGKLHIGKWNGGDVPGSQNLTAGSWHHVALIHDGATTSMYVDGVLDAQENRLYDTVLSGTFRMATTGNGEFFKGAVDELAVYSRALTAAEIMTSYSAGSAGFCAAPVDVTPPVTTASPAAGQLSLPLTVTLASNETANIYTVIEPVATFSAVLQSAFYNGHFYYLIPSQNWSDSEARAQSLGGHLVTVNDEAENTFLYSTFTNIGAIDRGLWIGLNDVAREGNFVWASGEENALFRKWASGGEPNNSGGGENWVYIFQPGDGRRQFWNDGPNTANPFGASLYGVVEVVPTLYSGPIPLSEAATVKYFAVDSAGNQEAVQSVTYSASLPVADTTAPTGSVAINPAATYTNLSTINLTLSCNDAGSGCSQMQFSNDSTNWSAPESVATTKSGWVLSAYDGLKTVFVKFQDGAGNWSTPYSATITLDTTPPVPQVSGARSVFTIATGLMDPRGIVVDADGVYFSEAGSNNDVVNYNNTDGKIRKVGKYGGIISTLSTGLTYPAVVASDATNVYWSYSDGTNSGSFLKSTAKVGGAMTTLVAGMNGSLMNAAVDTTNVYWLETGTGSAGWSSTNDSAVNKIAKDGTGTKVSLVSNVRIGYGSLTIDSSYVYWAGYMGHNVGRIGLDGSNPLTLASGDYPTSVKVDATSVYWLTGGGTISKMNKDGTGQQYLASAPSWQNGPLVIDETNVYWMEYGTTLKLIPKTGGAVTTLLAGLPGVGIVADATGIYWAERGTLANNYRDGSIKKLGYSSAMGINSGAATTSNLSVTLTFSAFDANGVSQMQFSNDGTTYDAPITYAASAAWSLAAGVGVKTVYVRFQDVAGNWSAPYSSSITLVTLDKAASSVTTWPTASTITYGQTLASSTLSGGASIPNGTFAFTTPTTAPAAGTETQSVTFTPTDAANYNSATSTVSVTVTQATQSITFGTAPALTSGGVPATVSAAATSGLPVVFTSLTAGVCTVSGSTVTPLSVGTCIIAADQVGNSSFSAAPQATQSFAVAPAVAPVADTVAPVITDFTTPASSTTRTVSVSSLTATDAVGVTGYLLSESDIPPRATDNGWSEAAPPEYLSSTWGNKTIYAYAKDAAGNIAVARSASVYIGFTPGADGVIVSAGVDAPIKAEPLLADAYKSLKFAMKLEIPTAEEVMHGRVAPLVNGVPKPDLSRTELNLGDTIVILRRVVGL